MRYVIKGPNGAHFSEFEVTKTAPVTLNNVLVGVNTHARPKFDAHLTRHAAKFDTEADAQLQIANLIKDPLSGELVPNELCGGRDAFKACTVHPTED